MIAQLICNRINHGKNKSIKAKVLTNRTISVNFYLSLPKWANDEKLITNDNISIIYSKVKGKTKRYIVNKTNKYMDYPGVGHSKYLCITKEYKIEDWLDIEFREIINILKKDRYDIFREVQSDLVLEQIGMVTKKWECINNRKYYDEPSHYWITRYNSKVDIEFYRGDNKEIDNLPF